MHQHDRDERVVRRLIDRRANRAVFEAMRAVPERRDLREKFAGGDAGRAFELRRVQLGQNHRRVLLQDPRRAAEHLRYGAFDVHLDEAHGPPQLQRIERDQREREAALEASEAAAMSTKGTDH